MVENHTYNIPLTLHCFDLVLRTHVQTLQKKIKLIRSRNETIKQSRFLRVKIKEGARK